MVLYSAKKIVRTYSRQAKRRLCDDEPPTKRRRVEEDESAASTPCTATTAPEAPTDPPSPTRMVSAPLSSSPQRSLPTFSDAPSRSSPPSSPAALESSPPPPASANVKRRPVFSLFKRKLKHSVSAPEVLSERSPNAQTPLDAAPQPHPHPHPPRKRMVQMQLDLASQHRKACKTCGMEYIPSNAADTALHKKFHAVNFGGVDCTKAMVERLRQKQVWSGSEGAFVAVVGRRDAIVLKNKARDVLKVVNTELAAVPVEEEELWGQMTLEKKGDDEGGGVLERCDRFRVYLYVSGQKCVGACLAERITEAFAVLGQEKVSEQDRAFEQDQTSRQDEAAEKDKQQPQQQPQQQQQQQPQPLPESHSSSISVSTTADAVLLGISRIWVSNQFRKQGLARRLLDVARGNFMYGLTVEKRLTAFSQPTESGGKLARRYFGCEGGWHVYMD